MTWSNAGNKTDSMVWYVMMALKPALLSCHSSGAQQQTPQSREAKKQVVNAMRERYKAADRIMQILEVCRCNFIGLDHCCFKN